MWQPELQPDVIQRCSLELTGSSPSLAPSTACHLAQRKCLCQTHLLLASLPTLRCQRHLVHVGPQPLTAWCRELKFGIYAWDEKKDPDYRHFREGCKARLGPKCMPGLVLSLPSQRVPPGQTCSAADRAVEPRTGGELAALAAGAARVL